jgi:glycosyltransferase involved in cell wall biosynthesis
MNPPNKLSTRTDFPSEDNRESLACLSVVIPAYNEEATLATIVEKVAAIPNLLEIIIVDDCSTDRTEEIGRKLAESDTRVRFTRHLKNGGKTEALKTAFALTTGKIVIIQDADLELDPSEIQSVIKPILEGLADVVYGSRFLGGKTTSVLFFSQYLGNKILAALSNLLTNLNMTDVETGYKAFRGDIIRNMIIKSRGFGFEVEVTAKISKLDCAIFEVPVSYYGRTYKQGKKIGVKDGIAAIWFIIRFNLFCSLRSSYRQIPKVLQTRDRD